MANIERDKAVEDFIDAWAHDYANDDWRALSAEDQMREGRRIMAAANRGAVDLLREARSHVVASSVKNRRNDNPAGLLARIDAAITSGGRQ